MCLRVVTFLGKFFFIFCSASPWGTGLGAEGRPRPGCGSGGRVRRGAGPGRGRGGTEMTLRGAPGSSPRSLALGTRHSALSGHGPRPGVRGAGMRADVRRGAQGATDPMPLAVSLQLGPCAGSSPRLAQAPDPRLTNEGTWTRGAEGPEGHREELGFEPRCVRLLCPPDCFCKTPSKALKVGVHPPESQVTVVPKVKQLIPSPNAGPAGHVEGSKRTDAPCPGPRAVSSLISLPGGSGPAVTLTVIVSSPAPRAVTPSLRLWWQRAHRGAGWHQLLVPAACLVADSLWSRLVTLRRWPVRRRGRDGRGSPRSLLPRHPPVFPMTRGSSRLHGRTSQRSSWTGLQLHSSNSDPKPRFLWNKQAPGVWPRGREPAGVGDGLLRGGSWRPPPPLFQAESEFSHLTAAVSPPHGSTFQKV